MLYFSQNSVILRFCCIYPVVCYPPNSILISCFLSSHSRSCLRKFHASWSAHHARNNISLRYPFTASIKSNVSLWWQAVVVFVRAEVALVNGSIWTESSQPNPALISLHDIELGTCMCVLFWKFISKLTVIKSMHNGLINYGVFLLHGLVSKIC